MLFGISKKSKPMKIQPVEVKHLIDSDSGTILIDVRTAEEFDETRIKTARSFPVEELENRIAEFTDKDAQIVIYCRSGRKSAIAADLMTSKGYTNVHDMGGINNWKYELELNK